MEKETMARSSIIDLTSYKVLSVIAIALQTVVIATVGMFDDYGAMCVASVLQLAFLVATLAFSPCRQLFVILFLVANWIFHCGQIACVAAGHNEVLNLDFRMYGSFSTIAGAFLFYLYSQSLLALGAVFFQAGLPKKMAQDTKPSREVSQRLAWMLVATGLPFWLYVNLAKLSGAAAEGYRGVYSLVIPAPIQAVSFFFEAGLLMFLLLMGRERKGTVLFWIVVAVKVVLMSTGGRQDAVCFLAVWCLVYFGYLRKLSLSRVVVLGFAAAFLLFAIDAFGELRNDGFSFDALASYLANASFFDVFWDSLGEFGSAFSTLVVSMTNVPTVLSFGMGSTYLAGVLSVIPMLVNNFAGLKASTLFTTAIPGTTYLGGSMLGEFYYNFGWFGLVGPVLTGCILAWCQNRLNLAGQEKTDLGVWLASVLAIFLLLFVRGYFTDAVMKLAYLCVFVWAADGLLRRVDERKTGAGPLGMGRCVR